MFTFIKEDCEALKVLRSLLTSCFHCSTARQEKKQANGRFILIPYVVNCCSGVWFLINNFHQPEEAILDISACKSDFVNVNGIRLHYLDWGGSGPVLLFLTGMGLSAYIYHEFA